MSAEDAATLFYEGTRLMEAGEHGQAEALFRRALEQVPHFAEVHANLGLLLDREGRRTEAEGHYRLALALDPSQAQTHLNLGALLERRKRFAEAEAAYREALTLAPEMPAAWSNLGVLLAGLKREEEAERCYRTAMALAPDYRTAPFNLAYLLLRRGAYEEGWQRLEARQGPLPLEQSLPFPRWQGEPLEGERLLIVSEGGHGDLLQFCRYAALLKQRRVGRVTLLCHPGLKALLAGHPDIDEVIGHGEPLPEGHWTRWVPLLSLPFLFETRLQTIPADLPYLTPPPERLAAWADRLGTGGGELRVGLIWRGNPQFDYDADRSLSSLATLAPLARVDGVRLFSLQKGAGEAEAARPPFALQDLGPHLDDFADTAAAMTRLDLIISVDTSSAHLAGALGRPCWLLLGDYNTDWRWLTGRDDSPWYPGVMRLFRQPAPGAWAPLVAEVADALREQVCARRAPASP